MPAWEQGNCHVHGGVVGQRYVLWFPLHPGEKHPLSDLC